MTITVKALKTLRLRPDETLVLELPDGTDKKQVALFREILEQNINWVGQKPRILIIVGEIKLSKIVVEQKPIEDDEKTL
jgi:hypothetical protein